MDPLNSAVPSNNAFRQPVQKWLSNGQSLHTELRNELKVLEAQLDVLKARVQEKRAQIEQIAQVLMRARTGAVHDRLVESERPVNSPADEALRIRAPYRRPTNGAAQAPAPDDAAVIPFRQ